MMRRLLLCGSLLTLGGVALAIDISPSKETVPRDSRDTGGNRFAIFNGDPKRIQRANEVDPTSFDTKLDASPNPLSLRALAAVGPNPSDKLPSYVHTKAK